MRTSKSNLMVAIIIAVALTGAVSYIYRLGGQNATLALRLRASDSTITALTQRQRAVDTVYRSDTIRLRQTVEKWSTLTRFDTVTVSVPADTVRLIVAAADTAIRACLVTVQTCEQRVAIRDSVIATLRAQRPLLKAQGSSLRSKALWAALGAGIGYIAADRR